MILLFFETELIQQTNKQSGISLDKKVCVFLFLLLKLIMYVPCMYHVFTIV